jgi:hypothetical protein
VSLPPRLHLSVLSDLPKQPLQNPRDLSRRFILIPGVSADNLPLGLASACVHHLGCPGIFHEQWNNGEGSSQSKLSVSLPFGSTLMSCWQIQTSFPADIPAVARTSPASGGFPPMPGCRPPRHGVLQFSGPGTLPNTSIVSGSIPRPINNLLLGLDPSGSTFSPPIVSNSMFNPARSAPLGLNPPT